MQARRRSQVVVGAVALAAFALVGFMFISRAGITPAGLTEGPPPTRLPESASVSPLGTSRQASPASPLATPQASPRPAAQTDPAPIATPAPGAVSTALPTGAPAVAVSATSTVNSAEASAVTSAVTSPDVSTAISWTEPVTEPGSVSVVSLPSVLAEEATPIATIPVYTYEVVAEYPHDPGAFTQGLQFLDGELYEGTGLRGRSSLRRVELETGTVLQRVDLDEQYFGEGISVIGDRIIQLTWLSNVAFVYERATFAPMGQYFYPTQGWGLTFDGTDLIMSDGTATLYRRDPETFEELGRIEVQAGDDLVPLLNELEYIKGDIFANVWQTNVIALIDPATGQVRGWLDLSGILDASATERPMDVLNGIAYDPAEDRIFVTGKLWPTLFEIELEPANP